MEVFLLTKEVDNQHEEKYVRLLKMKICRFHIEINLNFIT